MSQDPRNELRTYLTETEYGITAKTSTSDNTISGEILEQIHLVLRNLVWNFNIKETYVDHFYSWLVILSAAAFTIFSTTNRLKGYNPGQLIFGRDMILPINHKVGW